MLFLFYLSLGLRYFQGSFSSQRKSSIVEVSKSKFVIFAFLIFLCNNKVYLFKKKSVLKVSIRKRYNTGVLCRQMQMSFGECRK